MSLLLNKYPDSIIEEQFINLFKKFNTKIPLSITDYNQIRSTIISQPNKERLSVDYENNIFIHFTFCSAMRNFPVQFHHLWNKYFANSPINDIQPILGTRNVNNLQQELVYNNLN
jgi:hypothetical protein